MTPEPDARALEEWTATAAIVYSLTLAAGAGYVFYASIRPVTIATGDFSELADRPWALAFVTLLALWVVGPLVLLVLGSIQLFGAFPRDVDGTPLGPSRFDPGAPYWQALTAACGELAAGLVLVVLILALSGKAAFKAQ